MIGLHYRENDSCILARAFYGLSMTNANLARYQNFTRLELDRRQCANYDPDGTPRGVAVAQDPCN